MFICLTIFYTREGLVFVFKKEPFVEVEKKLKFDRYF